MKVHKNLFALLSEINEVIHILYNYTETSEIYKIFKIKIQ